ncbi:MAG: flagellar motor switch protein FliN [Buchnera aphidicola (Eriosoma harunire)]
MLDKKNIFKNVRGLVNNIINNNNVTSDHVMKDSRFINNKDVLNRNSNFINDVSIQVSIELGSRLITVKDFLKLSKGSILFLNNHLDHPLNIFVNEILIAQGELVTLDNKYGIRITKIIHVIDDYNAI